MKRQRAPVALVGLIVLALPACRPTVGTACDEELARAVVHSASGQPAYVGQSMLINSCAGGGAHCHASTAVSRYGAPHGMDFDPVLVDALVDRANGTSHLREAQRLSHRLRDDVFAEVATGAMPPGMVGDDVLPTRDAYAYDDGWPVPTVRSAEGRELLRNWLACGSPVVESTTGLAAVACARDADCVSEHCDDGACRPVGAVEPALAISAATGR